MDSLTDQGVRKNLNTIVILCVGLFFADFKSEFTD